MPDREQQKTVIVIVSIIHHRPYLHPHRHHPDDDAHAITAKSCPPPPPSLPPVPPEIQSERRFTQKEKIYAKQRDREPGNETMIPDSPEKGEERKTSVRLAGYPPTQQMICPQNVHFHECLPLSLRSVAHPVSQDLPVKKRSPGDFFVEKKRG